MSRTLAAIILPQLLGLFEEREVGGQAVFRLIIGQGERRDGVSGSAVPRQGFEKAEFVADFINFGGECPALGGVFHAVRSIGLHQVDICFRDPRLNVRHPGNQVAVTNGHLFECPTALFEGKDCSGPSVVVDKELAEFVLHEA